MRSQAITIIGAGMVGLTLAALLKKNNFSVTVIESKKQNEKIITPTARVSLLHNTSQKILSYLDAWSSIPDHAKTPVKKMQIWDYTQQSQLQLNAEDTSHTQIGWIVENHALVSVLKKKLQENIIWECTPVLSEITSDYIIGADGANSVVREKMKIDLTEKSYKQTAITAVIRTTQPHNNIAYQKFLTTGPVALLPLHDAHHTALVWSQDHDAHARTMQLSKTEFEQALTHALDYKLGELILLSERQSHPLIMRHVTEYTKDHFILVGDAAHTIHPLAGLGVNLGLMDAACLTDVLCNKKSLRAYTRWAKSNNQPVITVMRALQTGFACNHPVLNSVRGVGINLLNDCSFIKKILLNLGMTHASDLPFFLK